MKRFKNGLFILFLLVLFIPVFVYADTFEPSVEGEEVASIGDTVEYTISLKTDMTVSEFETTLSFNSKLLKLSKISPEEKWTLVKTDNANNLRFINNSVTGSTTVVKLQFTVINTNNKGTTSVKFDELRLSSTGDEPTIKTSDAITKSLKIRSDDNTLKAIVINDKLISGFSATTYQYTIEVNSNIDEATIKATLNDEASKFVDGFGERKETLEFGENTFLIKVLSESGKEQAYKVIVIRKDDRVVNNNLKSVLINSGEVKLNFDPSVLSYTVKTFQLTDYTIEALPDDENAKVKIDKPDKLEIGENIITITVTAVTKDTKVYTITIINNNEPTDTRLKNLYIKGVDFEFDSDVSKYEVMYNKVMKDDFKLYTTSFSRDVTITTSGTENIKPGSTIKVFVTAIDGSGETVYTINIKKDNRVNFFFIVETALLVILSVVVVILVKKRKKKKEEEIIKEEELEEELGKTKEMTL